MSCRLVEVTGTPPRRGDLPALQAGCSLPLRESHPLPLVLKRAGGGERDRTDDLLRAKQVLSQLSYTPEKWWA